MKNYSANPRHAKAAMILAAMSPDMVLDIVGLVNARGTSITNDLADNDGPPKALAFMSREFISDEDFPAVFTGLMTCYMAAYRQPSDNDFYEKILIDGCYAPKAMAAKMAKQIETSDPITSRDSNGNKVGFVRRKWLQAQDVVRRTVNWFPALLGINWENDQAQTFDTDRLYELKLLGEAVDNLASRSRLVKAQENIRLAFGITMGDVSSDPVAQHEVEIVQAMRPLVGAPVPAFLFGKLKQFVTSALAAHKEEVARKLAQSGHAPVGTNSPAEPSAVAASDRLTSGASTSIEPVIRNCVSHEAIGDVLDSHRGTYGDVDSLDLSGLADIYGSEFADKLQTGDVAGAYGEIYNGAHETVTTGDPQLDEEIIATTLDEMGDVYDDEIPEIGGLFKRARINANLKKAARLRRKNTRRAQKVQRKDKANDSVLRSKAAVNNARHYMPEEEIYEEEVPEQQYYDENEDIETNGDEVFEDDISAGLEP